MMSTFNVHLPTQFDSDIGIMLRL